MNLAARFGGNKAVRLGGFCLADRASSKQPGVGGLFLAQFCCTASLIKAQPASIRKVSGSILWIVIMYQVEGSDVSIVYVLAPNALPMSRLRDKGTRTAKYFANQP